MRASVVLIIYAASLFGAGLLAFSMAPEGANAKTALIVPGACAALIMVLAIAILAIKSPGVRVKLHVAALVLTLIFAAAFSLRAMDASGAVQAHRNAAAQLDRAIEAGQVEDTPEARQAFYEREDAPDHDKSYLATTLWVLVVLSALSLFAGLVSSPNRKPTEAPPQS